MHDINRSEKYSLSIYLKVLCILVLSFPVLLLADEYDVSGIIESINSHDVQPISETHIILLASMEEKLVLDDPDSPWHGATGPCGGAVEIKDGAINGSGYCTFTDKDNDKFVISWTPQSMNEKGGPIGVWEVVGGNGKYQGASGSGGYNDMPSDDPTISTITLTGKLVIP